MQVGKARMPGETTRPAGPYLGPISRSVRPRLHRAGGGEGQRQQSRSWSEPGRVVLDCLAFASRLSHVHADISRSYPASWALPLGLLWLLYLPINTFHHKTILPDLLFG